MFFFIEDRKNLIGKTIVPDSYCYDDYVVDLLNGYCYKTGTGKQMVQKAGPLL